MTTLHYGYDFPDPPAPDAPAPLPLPVGWKTTDCDECDGTGMKLDYGLGGGGDFDGADDCPKCYGSGSLLVTPAGRLKNWPSGPFVGSLGKADMDR